jgi:hypothetical protein
MRVGFLSNQLDNRGTGNAMFDYAYYNEKILGNKSIIYTYKNGNHNAAAVERFGLHFPIVVDPDPMTSAVDVMYHIKSGEDDGVRFPRTKYAVHAVFNAGERHGDRYAAVSAWLGERDRVPYVPHIVSLPEHSENMRAELGIPTNATVFGRHGGFDTFDIPFVWNIVKYMAGDDIYFLFMNTAKPDFIDHPNIIFLPETASEVKKRKFVNTCDAMVNARARGETFGLACAEFASCGKPVLTYSVSPERAHLVELAEHKEYFYDTENALFANIMLFNREEPAFAYTQHSPEAVMKKFDEVFLR